VWRKYGRRFRLQDVILWSFPLVIFSLLACMSNFLPMFFPPLRDPCKKKANLSLCLISWALCREYVWGRGGIVPPLLNSALDGDGGQLHATVALPPGWSPRYPLDRKLFRAQNRSGRCGEEKNLALPVIESGRPARSPSLYRLSYPNPRDPYTDQNNLHNPVFGIGHSLRRWYVLFIIWFNCFSGASSGDYEERSV
jgi:hypothetical protein